MRIYLLKSLVLLLLLVPVVLSGQKQTNHAFLQDFARLKEKESKEAEKRVAQWAKKHNVQIKSVSDDGTIMQLIDIEDGKPVYIITDNVGAAITTRAYELWEGGSSGLNLTGEGYNRLGEWDGGAVRLTHQEFNNLGSPRVAQTDGATSLSDHATHVAGTLVGGGANANAKGMSYKGTLRAHDWNNAEAEMASAAANNLEISNHSYGWVTGWNNSTGSWIWHGDSTISNQEDYRFGRYGPRSRDWDQIAYNAPFYLIVKSAGNHRGAGPSNAGQGGLPPKNGGALGFDCVSDGGTAKNMMSIGAVSQVLNYTGPGSVSMSSFSSWGPVDDGRIKPDVVAKGVSVYSAGSNNNTHYSSKSGTSMSSPNAAGTMALLQQHYQQTHGGASMRASTLKALVIHTADEAGPHEGPDYMFGWGLVNALRAADMISEDDVLQNVIDEITLVNNEVYVREVASSGNQPLRVTITWTDLPGTVPAPALNDRTPALVHDLDLRVMGPDGTIYYPYRLDPENPTAAAVNDSKNYVDNVEQVYIPVTQQGTYTIIVDHDGSLTADQVFSLVVSGINEYQGIPFCSGGLSSPENGSTDNLLNTVISWQQAPFAVSYLVYFGTDGEGTTTPTNLYNGEAISDNSFSFALEANTTYYLKVLPVNDFGTNDECAEIYSFSTITAINEFPYIMNVEGVTPPNIPSSWQQLQYSNAKWVTTNLISHGGNRSMGCYNPNGMVLTPLNNWLVSPPVMVELGKEYNIRFYYRAFLPGTNEILSLWYGNSADSASLTNNLVSLSQFDGAAGWMMAEALLIPDATGLVYLGWKAETNPGYGVFIDDIIVEDWGAVGMSERALNSVKAHYSNGTLNLDLLRKAEAASIRVIASDGRVVKQQRIQNEQNIQIQLNVSPGMYIVHIEGAGFTEKAKFIVK